MEEEAREEVVLDEMDGWDNDVEESDTPDDDFDNFGVENEVDEEESTEETEASDETEDEPDSNDVEETEETEENTNESEETEDTMMLKYNHEEKDYTVSEVKDLAQKGMNYDKKVEELTALQSSPAIEFVRQQAKGNDMTDNT